MIEAKGIKKSFGDFLALKDVDINVNKGSIYGLLGSNGAGKSTLLKILSGVYESDEGTALIDEAKVYENIDIKNKIIFLNDELFFFSQFSINDMGKFYKSIYSNFDEERFQKLKEVFKLDMNKKISSFSKGMQRQAAFWLALSSKPDYMILDEPFDGLDPIVRYKVKNLIVNDVAEREMTVIISSHNIREIEDLCDHIGIIHEGEIVVEKELDQLKADVHKVQVAFKDNETTSELEKELEFVHKESRGSINLYIVKGEREEVIEKIEKHNPILIDVLPLTLEEIFVYEMGDLGYELEKILC